METTKPKTGIAGLKENFKQDFSSGFSVSLIALPLCLGIALASGVPPLAGLITAIVGGLFASRISGTFVTISGPAAGLIVVILAGVESLGGAGAENGYAGYPHTLGAILIAGLIMTILGFLKVGKVGDFFPKPTVRGMLAAIGVIIMIKQIYPALGIASPKGSILEVAAHLPFALGETNVSAAVIAVVSAVVLVAYPKVNWKPIKIIPAPMWVMIISIIMGRFLSGSIDTVIMPHHLLGEDGIAFPSFEKIGESAFWSAVIAIALVAGLESLLSAKAVDELDPYHRKSNLDRDLISMGSGSSLAALFGGLPMISEIVRSSANVSNGGKTQWANFFHGLFLLIFLLVASAFIELIPLSALAAMLVVTGWRLFAPAEMKRLVAIGVMEFVVFLTTLLAVLATDLIIGIGIGILANYLILLFKGVAPKYFFSIAKSSENGSVSVQGALSFSNYLRLKKTLDQAFESKDRLVLNVAGSTYIDHTTMVHLDHYQRRKNLENKTFKIEGMDALKASTNHEFSERKA
ncbi:MAG: hypothetical protein RL754_140 [Bacteroidota bacterium]|jgi:MFS superfamily sulfate permease-like transporter